MPAGERRPYVMLDANLFQNPKILEAVESAGSSVIVVWVALLCANGQHRWDGVVPRRFIEAGWLSRYAAVEHEEKVYSALAALFAAGCITRLDDGAAELVGWDEWRPGGRTGAERTAAWRERAVTDAVTRDNGDKRCHGDGKQISREQTSRETAMQSARERGERIATMGVDEAASYNRNFERVDALLVDVGYHNRSAAKRQATASIHVLDGMTHTDLETIWAYAQERGRAPKRLLAAWLKGRDQWRAVLAEATKTEALK